MGIDPSFSSTGIVVLTNAGDSPIVATTIKAGLPNQKFFKRMKILLDKLAEIVLLYPVEETLVIMEGSAFASEFNAFKLGKLSGVIEYWLGSQNLDYGLVAPSTVKKVATGKGVASKEQVMAGVESRWGFKHKSNDVCDAYTLAQIAKGAEPLPSKPKEKWRIECPMKLTKTT